MANDAAPDKMTRLRIGAAFVGAPLISTLFVSWTWSHEARTVLEMVDAFEHQGWVAMPLLGLVFLTAAFGPCRHRQGVRS